MTAKAVTPSEAEGSQRSDGRNSRTGGNLCQAGSDGAQRRGQCRSDQRPLGGHAQGAGQYL